MYCVFRIFYDLVSRTWGIYTIVKFTRVAQILIFPPNIKLQCGCNKLKRHNQHNKCSQNGWQLITFRFIFVLYKIKNKKMLHISEIRVIILYASMNLLVKIFRLFFRIAKATHLKKIAEWQSSSIYPMVKTLSPVWW